jgi:hypothetical protein
MATNINCAARSPSRSLVAESAIAQDTDQLAEPKHTAANQPRPALERRDDAVVNPTSACKAALVSGGSAAETTVRS